MALTAHQNLLMLLFFLPQASQLIETFSDQMDNWENVQFLNGKFHTRGEAKSDKISKN